MVGVRYATPASQRAFSRALGQKSTRKYATTKDVEGKAPLKTLSTGARRAKLHNGGGDGNPGERGQTEFIGRKPAARVRAPRQNATVRCLAGLHCFLQDLLVP